MLRSDVWCPNECWRPTDHTDDCIFCDYSKHGENDCAKHNPDDDNNDNNDDNQKNNKERSCKCDSDSKDIYCTASNLDIDSGVISPSQQRNGWDTLELGQWRRYQKIYQQNGLLYYRFYAPDPCKYLRIVVQGRLGTPILEIATPKTWSTNLEKAENPYVLKIILSLTEVIICPTDEYFAPGTYYLKVSTASPFMEFDILAEAIGIYK